MKPHETPDGVKYLIRHERPVEHGGFTIAFGIVDGRNPPEGYRTSQKGGTTVVTIVDDEGEPIMREQPRVFHGDPIVTTRIEGFAHCRPEENYNKKLGKTIALGRALKALRTG